ncbi:type III-B CRISPR module RAMP protein Cmr6 [Candidatus Chrysopegis kryptomonas]|uniref:CRISPR-associated protein, Cmr6 family n=1 Tax=Candidatus Chryseopegocella kryptomonas TaxID=1633643 RepID=A0A0P1NZK1_9BACT|nr:type III-B CRISPR module RAMP protein Cmr6 [Candidatus Chrysopegis kryptomonas]CUT04652.1 CRISPR-associated protein, Cmr6 family [Candidatus Chrysopegis kryptomonas]
MKEERFKIEGEVWFGGAKNFKRDISVQERKEREAKEKFIDKIKEVFKESFCEKLLNQQKNEEKFVCWSNLILILNKYVPIVYARVSNKKNQGEDSIWLNYAVGEESKKVFLDVLIETFNNSFYFKQSLESLKKRIEVKIQILENQHYEKIPVQPLKTQSCLIIGLGSQHVLETSITLHHIFGVPYIPGSALKGVCRAVVFWKLAEDKRIQNNQNELEEFQKKFYGELAKDDEEILKYQILFGAQNFKGLLLFLDAYPYPTENNSQIFDLDVMNVHYPSYYEGSGTPGDWENPRPIFFLVVKEGVEFQFNVLFDKFRAEEILKMTDEELKKNGLPEKIKELTSNLLNSNLKNEMEYILKQAISEFGVGSKTRLGYGLFQEIQ